MRYREYPPPRRLGDHIECLWTLESEIEVVGDPERVLPDGTLEIVVHYGRPFEEQRRSAWVPQPRAHVVGPMSRALNLRSTSGGRVLGIRLKAPGAASLFGLPLRELADQVVPLEEIGGRALVQELQGNGWDLPRSLVVRACRALGKRLAPIDEPGRLAATASGRIFSGRGGVRVRDLAADLGVGERRLERAFDVAVGLSPKRLARVARLQAVLISFNSRQSSLAATAADCGYADQAHLTREFRELVGTSPAAFRAERHALADLFASEGRLERLLDPALAS